jgi:hypothetical protein
MDVGPEVIKQGKIVATIQNPPDDFGPWVGEIAANSGVPVDWQLSKGLGYVYFLGGAAEHRLVAAAIEGRTASLSGGSLNIVPFRP